MNKITTIEIFTRPLRMVSTRQMSIIFLTTAISACGAGNIADPGEESSPQLGAASAVANVATDITTSSGDSNSGVDVAENVKAGVDSPFETNVDSGVMVQVMEILAGSVDESEQDLGSTSKGTGEVYEKVSSEVDIDSLEEKPDAVSPESEGTGVEEQTKNAGVSETITEQAEPDSTEVIISNPGGDTVANGISFNKFRQNTSLPSRYRSMFGCGGTIEDRWMDLADSWPNTWNVSSRGEFDAAIANMDNGDRILIENGTNLGAVELSSSGNPDAKKYIMGKSSCNDVDGPDTFSTSARFEISGNDWVLMNMKFKPTSQGRAFGITGARNWIYNNRVEDAGEVKIVPQGTPDAPTTTGIRIVGNYFNGRSGQAGVRMLNPFGRLDTASMYDFVIGGNTFENYVEPSYGPKVITDVTFGWNYPYKSDTDLPGAETFTEIGWNHFIDTHGEVPSSKSRRWLIHDNLFESTPNYRGKDPTHISLRSGDDKLVYRNIILDGHSRLAQKGLQINAARSHGYYNVIYRSDNGGIGFTWTTTETFPHYPYPDKTFFRNERLEDIDWRYNFFLGDSDDTASWLRFGTLGSASDVSLPPTRNTIRDNFYSAEDPNRIILAITDSKHGLSESDWDANNPNAVRALQHFGYRSGDLSTLDRSVTVPGSVTIENFWLNGSDVRIDLPPWIGTANDDLIHVTDD